MLELIVISTLNGVLFGMLLFLLSSGLTVIFSMMGVLNFAHASFYMLGAFFGYPAHAAGSASGRPWCWRRCWWARSACAVERYGLAHTSTSTAMSPELLLTFGLAFAIEEIVQMIWGKSPVDYRVPRRARLSRLHASSPPTIPPTRCSCWLVSVAIFVALLIVLKRTRVGLIVQAALTHPHMVGHLGHNVGRVFMLVFGVGSALAGWPASSPAPRWSRSRTWRGLLGPILFVVIVFGGLGSLPGAFIASLLIGLFRPLRSRSTARWPALFGPLDPGLGPSLLTDIWNVTIAQIAPILPYVLLVLILIVRPMGLLGTRET